VCVCMCYVLCMYGWVDVCVYIRLIMHAFVFVEVLRFPHARVYHQQPPAISISADRQMENDKVCATCGAFQFTFIFVMNDREF